MRRVQGKALQSSILGKYRNEDEPQIWWHQPFRRWSGADHEGHIGTWSVSYQRHFRITANLFRSDCTHPEANSLAGTPSIAAIVGSVDSKGGKFLGSMRLQPRLIACENIQDVESMVVERLMAWFMANKHSLPKNIIYYRDGVSDR